MNKWREVQEKPQDSKPNFWLPLIGIFARRFKINNKIIMRTYFSQDFSY